MPRNDALPAPAESRQRDLLEYLDGLGERYAGLKSEITAAYDDGACFDAFDRINQLAKTDPNGPMAPCVLAAMRLAGDVLRILDTEAIRAAADALSEPASGELRASVLSAVSCLTVANRPEQAARRLDMALAAGGLTPYQDAALRRMLALVHLRAG